MFLDIKNGRSTQVPQTDRTFGGNIHELLKDSFFLDKGYMGEFSKRKIQSASNYLDRLIKGTQNENSGTESDIRWDKEGIRKFIDLIGEPILRNSLREMYETAFFDKVNVHGLDLEIKRLQNLKAEKLKAK